VSGFSAPAIKGDYIASDVLSLLLKGTRLRAVHINDDTFQVLDHPSSRRLTDRSSTLPYVDPSSVAAAAGAAVAGAGTATTGAATSGDATETPQPEKGLEEIVVTGTHIRGVENKTVPLMTFDRADIERSGYATTEDFIASLPQNVKSGENSADGAVTGVGLGNIENSTAANLRGLGSSSTLTLLNGHRVAPSSYGSGVDLSMIPLSAVERIEVLTDGSSAVYGSDAVGGVVNIILRRDFDGQESSARLDTLSRGGGEQKQLGQSIGRNWSSGGALAVLQFQEGNAIHADQRSFTAALPEPTDVFPETKRYAGVFSGHQFLTGSLELFGDVLAEHATGFRAYNTGGAFGQIELLHNNTNSQSVNTGLRFEPFGDWHLEANTLFSQTDTNSSEAFTPTTPGYTNGAPYLRNLDTIKEADLKLDGTLWASGGASLKAAIGGSYRREDFSSLLEFLSADRPMHRRVSAEYAEIYAPLITNANALPGVRHLEFSAAVRRDAYSDFGARTNPRFGVFWSPVDEIGLRAAYSTSFRAPNADEITNDLTANAIFIESGYALPNGATGNALFFGNRILGPETSHNFSAGLDFKPRALPGTRFSLNYYRIIYANRIINAPSGAADVFVNPSVYGPLVKPFASDAAVEAFVAGLQPPQTIYDFTSGGTGLAGVRFGFPYGDINASREKTEGLDLGARSLVALTTTDKLTLDLNATYIRTLSTAFCSACTATDLVNTWGQPLKLRLRAAAGWSNGVWSTNAAVNYANGYTDTNVLPFGHIASYTTTDLNAGWRIPASPGTLLSLSLVNAFDAGPPRTAPSFNRLAYDPSNADPRGRALSIQIRQKW
jgi:outer membrane receptor protein involved in Fe transport